MIELRQDVVYSEIWEKPAYPEHRIWQKGRLGETQAGVWTPILGAGGHFYKKTEVSDLLFIKKIFMDSQEYHEAL